VDLGRWGSRTFKNAFWVPSPEKGGGLPAEVEGSFENFDNSFTLGRKFKDRRVISDSSEEGSVTNTGKRRLA
jgi:hypothetical protein